MESMTATIQTGMAITLFITGIGMLICGLVIIMTREYQEAMRSLAGQSSRLSSKALADIGVQATLRRRCPPARSHHPPGADGNRHRRISLCAGNDHLRTCVLDDAADRRPGHTLTRTGAAALRSPGASAFLCVLGTIICGLAFWMMLLIGDRGTP
jgi:hypothetical protein